MYDAEKCYSLLGLSEASCCVLLWAAGWSLFEVLPSLRALVLENLNSFLKAVYRGLDGVVARRSAWLPQHHHHLHALIKVLFVRASIH